MTDTNLLAGVYGNLVGNLVAQNASVAHAVNELAEKVATVLLPLLARAPLGRGQGQCWEQARAMVASALGHHLEGRLDLYYEEHYEAFRQRRVANQATGAPGDPTAIAEEARRARIDAIEAQLTDIQTDVAKGDGRFTEQQVAVMGALGAERDMLLSAEVQHDGTHPTVEMDALSARLRQNAIELVPLLRAAAGEVTTAVPATVSWTSTGDAAAVSAVPLSGKRRRLIGDDSLDMSGSGDTEAKRRRRTTCVYV